MEDDEDDPYGSAEEDAEEDDLDDDDVDTDVLPTLLAYRDGELVHTWVRVDWEAEAVGSLEELLSRYVSISSDARPKFIYFQAITSWNLHLLLG
jgi:hypothetical protein